MSCLLCNVALHMYFTQRQYSKSDIPSTTEVKLAKVEHICPLLDVDGR